MKTSVVGFDAKAFGGHADCRSLAPFLFAFLLGVALLSGCGGGAVTQPTAPSTADPPPAAPPSALGDTPVLVNLGEYAAVPEQVVAFELTIDSVALRSSKGDVSLLSTPRRVELSRLKAEPLLLGSAPQGKYSEVVVNVSNPEVSFIDSNGVLHEDVVASLTSSTATTPSEIGFAPTPGVINIHLGFTVGFGGSVVTVTPGLVFSTSAGPAKDLVGRITTVGSSSLTIDLSSIGDTNAVFTFTTDSGTKFQGVTALHELTVGATVEVDAAFGSDGTLRAKKIKLENDLLTAHVVEGLTLSTSPAQLRMLVREVHGPDTGSLPGVGKVLTVATNASSQFRLEPDDIDLSNLDFTPSFDTLTIALGQNVRAAAASGSATTITADQLKLEEQSLVGTASAVTSGSVSGQFSFPMTLAPDSAFAQLTGHTSVLVTLQPSAEKFLYFGLEDCVTCIAGGTVRVRGLLFFSGGQYRLIAEWLSVG